MIVDFHAHYIPKNFRDLKGDRFLPRVGVPVKTGFARHPVSDAREDISGRFELMDAACVEKILHHNARRCWAFSTSA